jgi:membrane-associated protein
MASVDAEEPPVRSGRRVSWGLVVAVAAGLLVLAAAGVLVMSLTDDALGLLEDPENEFAAYLVVSLLVMGDAVIAILPGETTLNVASVLASEDKLTLGLVIVAGAIGATVGDNILYWVARSVPGLRVRVARAQEDPRFERALEVIGRHESMLVIFCRYLPFVRWAVIAGMGVLPMPYRRFLVASVIGGVGWATYTCLVAYLIGTALDEFPLLSLVIAGVSSGVLVTAVYFVERRWSRRSGGPEHVRAH